MDRADPKISYSVEAREAAAVDNLLWENPVMKRNICTMAWLLCLLAIAAPASRAAAAVHVWEKQELSFTSSGSYANPYTDVIVWIDLSGPHFHKRVYGFWDGGNTFRVGLVATEPGTWKWRSGSAPSDKGLDGGSGSFTAISWSEEEKQQNPLRRGFLRPTPDHHALELADGTPFIVIGDT